MGAYDACAIERGTDIAFLVTMSCTFSTPVSLEHLLHQKYSASASAPTNEPQYFGRTPIYIVSFLVSLLFVLGSALAPNLGGFLALRFLSGLFSSVTIANFGGTIADLWPAHATGPAMSFFLWAATVGSPLGYFLFSFVAQYRPWRDVLWAIMGVMSGTWIGMSLTLLICGETRHSVLLLRRVKRLRRQGERDVDVPEEMRKRGVGELFKVALTRPFRFLGTEAIIIFGVSFSQQEIRLMSTGLMTFAGVV